MKKRFLLLIALFFSAPLASSAARLQPSGFVNDFASVLRPSTQQQLEQMLVALERQSGVEVVVATLASLEEEPVEDVAVELFKAWGIGKKGKDNGLLFLVAQNERKTRIEVGYGLEGAINDALAGRILDQVVLPRFKAGKLDEGIAVGTVALVSAIAKAEGIPFDLEKSLSGFGISQQPQRRGKELPWLLKIVLFLVAGYLFIRHPWLFLFFLSMGRGGGMGGGGFSRGFGGFGGGLSGGGGATRSW